MLDHKSSFLALEEHGPYSVYGEWMIQQHGMEYDNLPGWFIAFDLYDWEKSHYIDPKKAEEILLASKFDFIPILFYGRIFHQQTLEVFANGKSDFAKNAQREGIVVKVSNGETVTAKFKMVRQGFDQGCLLSNEIKRNQL